MISVVIPVLNESLTIGKVISFALQSAQVGEVIVVDDGSIDETAELARAAGAAVLTSTLLGKGASMEDGMRGSHGDVILFLDGDLSGLREDLIERMSRPIIEGQADFVKARFTRTAGRVTTLTARPLLQVFFPELVRFEQPLGGIIAARRTVLENLRFETDYGVDVGLLIDAAAHGAHVVEVDIGHIEHDSHPLEVLGDMATQVVRTLLDRAARMGRLNSGFMREVEEIERHQQAELAVVLRRVGAVERLALFDMDGVLLSGRYVVALADRLNKKSELSPLLDNFELTSEERTRRIAAIFTGVHQEVLAEVAKEMPLTPGAVETVVGLRKAGYRVGIVTDGFRIAAEIVRRRVFADFSIAHLMKFRRGKSTGMVTLSRAMVHPRGCVEHQHCKRNVMHHLLDWMRLTPEHVLAVGDGDNDICLLHAAGTSVAFNPQSQRVRAAAMHVVRNDLSGILRILNLQCPPRPSHVQVATSPIIRSLPS
jgi:phosphoserine phosphatase